jgi:phage gpG-like protein
MDVNVSIETREVRKVLVGIRWKMRSYRSVFDDYRTYLETAYAINFATGGSLVGGWPPEKAYGSWSSASGYTALFRTGRLTESLTNLRGAPNDINLKSATFGTNVSYAKFHQMGTSEMPRRPVVFLPEGTNMYLAERTAQYLDPNPMLGPLKAMIYR